MAFENRSGNRACLRTSGVALLAAAAGAGTFFVPTADAAAVSCKVTSSSSSNVESVDGFADAVLDLAAFACGGNTKVIPVDERITAVASAMAEAVASVTSTCSGEGNAQAVVSGLARAEARAEAVGSATVRIVATSEVCQLCQSSLKSLVDVTESVTATAVAEARVQASFRFQEGATQEFTANAVQRVIENNIVEVLAAAVGEIRADAEDGCSANAIITGQVGDSFAMCDVSVSADSILVQIDAVADVGATLQGMACNGEINTVVGPILAREIAVATVQAVVLSQASCESSGGPDTMACGMTMGTVTDVATAQARALVDGMVSIAGPGCGCDLSASVSLSEVETIMAEASAAALVEVCTEGEGTAFASLFQIEAEESMAVAIASLMLEAATDSDCITSITLDACAEAGQCVDSNDICSASGDPAETLECCQESDVCAQLPNSSVFRCQAQAAVAATPGAEVVAC